MSATLTVRSTDEAPPREAKGYWGEIVSRSFGRLQSDTYGDDNFRGRVAYSSLGDVQVGTLEASRHRVVRVAGSRGASDPGHLKLVVQRRGRCLFEQNGRRAWLRTGDWSLYDTTLSYIVSAPEAVDLHVLMLPREAVLRGQRELEALLVRRLRGTGMGRVACAAIGRALETPYEGAAALQAGADIAQLIHLALVEQAGARREPLQRAVLRERAKAFVHEHLADPELRIDAVARALQCSKRAVHQAFELEDCSFNQYLWERRLAAVRAQLEAPAAAGRTIGEIAFAWGFSSAAHFSRAFRALYGVSASDWRRGLRPGSNGPAQT
jgi:AraC-like DNA-binding protein